MIKGLRTVIYHVTDLRKGKEWYRRALKREPYFDQPFYVGFSVGGFELGLIPDGASGVGGSVAYWGVDDIQTSLQELLDLGATMYEPIQDVGEGIKTATVKDPFGNLLGIIENPHFKKNAVE